jgi:polyisoprenyl-phosphate glycosyltransferase
MMSIVVPVYKNAETIAPLLESLADLSRKFEGPLEVVFVVDGSPDESYLRLRQGLVGQPFRAQLLQLSRNFGSFAAIRAGLEFATGNHFSVLAADLQEPPDLVLEFEERLSSGECDVVIGVRGRRADPALSKLGSGLFWALYRRWVQPDLPPGGVDVFGCSKPVRDQLLKLDESNSSLIGLLFWIGFRRAFVSYDRRARVAGRSAWTLPRKLRYLSDSVYNFTDLPVRLLFRVGVLGVLSSVIGGAVVLAAKLNGQIPVAGYAATVLLVVFFGALNCLGIGIIGSYAWRTLENTKRRPNFLVASRAIYDLKGIHDVVQASEGPSRER